jgi:hypothetical protein
MMTSFIICIHTKYYSSNQIKKNEMDWMCDMYGGKKRCIQSFGGETRVKETSWKNYT